MISGHSEASTALAIAPHRPTTKEDWAPNRLRDGRWLSQLRAVLPDKCAIRQGRAPSAWRYRKADCFQPARLRLLPCASGRSAECRCRPLVHLILRRVTPRPAMDPASSPSMAGGSTAGAL